jgi:hypothetical protein
MTESHQDAFYSAKVRIARACGLVFQNPRLTGQSLRALYAKADYFGLRGSNNRMLWDARGDLGRGLVGKLTHGRGSGGLL